MSAEMLRFEAPGTVARFDPLPLHDLLIRFFSCFKSKPSESVIFVIISFILEFLNRWFVRIVGLRRNRGLMGAYRNNNAYLLFH